MDTAVFLLGGVAVAMLIWAFVASIFAYRLQSKSGELGVENRGLKEETERIRERFDAVKEDSPKLKKLEIDYAKKEQELNDKDLLLDRTEKARKEIQENNDKERERFQGEIRELERDKEKFSRDLKNANEQLQKHSDLVKEATDSFKVLSAETLERQQKSFMETAGQSLKSRQEAVEKLVKPLTEKIENLDKARVATATEFREQMKVLTRTNENLATGAESLANALKRPDVRGRWGEIQLERVLELSGLKRDIDYTVQETFTIDGDRLRTDVIVRMPNDRNIVLDSKVSMVGILDAFEAADGNLREQAMDRHVGHVVNHIDTLADKKYWEVLASTPDMVIMVMPEFAFLPAVEREPGLTERALRKNVIIVTPPALLALLKAVELTWQQIKVAETAKQISDLGRELHRDLIRYADNVAKVGRGLQSAVRGYNDSVGTFEGTIMGRARRFSDLGVTLTQEAPSVQEVTDTPRSLASLPETEFVENAASIQENGANHD